VESLESESQAHSHSVRPPAIPWRSVLHYHSPLLEMATTMTEMKTTLTRNSGLSVASKFSLMIIQLCE